MSFELSSRVISGEGQLENIPTLLKDRGLKDPAVLCDKNLFESSKYIRSCLDKLKEEFKLAFFLYDYPFEPSYQFIDTLNQEVMDSYGEDTIDCWIGIGGGSAMDSAKVLAILAKNKGKAIEYKGFPENLNSPLPVICIPSTTGTGSEVVFNASLIDEDTKVKMGVNYKKNYPLLAILDPTFPNPIKPMQVSFIKLSPNHHRLVLHFLGI